MHGRMDALSFVCMALCVCVCVCVCVQMPGGETVSYAWDDASGAFTPGEAPDALADLRLAAAPCRLASVTPVLFMFPAATFNSRSNRRTVDDSAGLITVNLMRFTVQLVLPADCQQLHGWRGASFARLRKLAARLAAAAAGGTAAPSPAKPRLERREPSYEAQLLLRDMQGQYVSLDIENVTCGPVETVAGPVPGFNVQVRLLPTQVVMLNQLSPLCWVHCRLLIV